MSEPNIIECVLCRKKKESPRYDGNWNWSRVCPECHNFWELGKRAEKATKADGKEFEVRVPQTIPFTVKLGNAEGVSEVKGTDVIAAMGAVSLRGTELGSRFGGAEKQISIIQEQDKSDWVYVGGQTLKMKVPQARALAMQKIVAAFLNAVARARVEGFNEGRNLLLGLAKGDVSLETYSEQADNARAGKKPKNRWSD